HFMTLEEIQILAGYPNVLVGAHSHFHDVVLTRKHPRKIKPVSQWKLERIRNRAILSREDLSIRSRLAFQGFDLRDGALVQRSEAAWEDYIKYDTELCLKWFELNLGFTPQMYCFPFNEYSDKFIALLKSFGFKQFYGARPRKTREIYGRIDIDALLNQDAG
ncbi:MAG: hypothetical protein JSW39_14160, partial [Desulfobacterales bacterium]